MRENIIFTSDMDVSTVRVSMDDRSVIESARVSFKGEDRVEIDSISEGDEKLIRYLMRNKHGTPFEHNSITFFISVPIFVIREVMRHRIGFSYNEESGRYRELKPKFYLPIRERYLKQVGRSADYTFIDGGEEMYEKMSDDIKEISTKSYKKYIDLLEDGIAKEVARILLPLNLYSTFYMTCNARSLMSFLSLRVRDSKNKYKSNPQYEIEQMALKMESYFKEYMPITYKYFIESGRVAP